MATVERPEYEVHDGTPIAVVYRNYASGQTLECPFCGLSHKHGPEDGHRVTHCITVHKRGVKVPPREDTLAADGTRLYRRNGYMVRTLISETPGKK